MNADLGYRCDHLTEKGRCGRKARRFYIIPMPLGLQGDGLIRLLTRCNQHRVRSSTQHLVEESMFVAAEVMER